MEPIVGRDPDGALVVERRRTLAQRLLVATVFLGLATYPLRYLVDSIQFYRAAATVAEWRQAAPGFVLVFFGFVVPVAATWLLTIRRHYLQIDPLRREIRVVRDDVVWSRRRAVPFSDVQQVELAAPQSGKGGTFHPVWLVLADTTRVPVCASRDRAAARQAAQVVATVLATPIVDRD